MKRKLIILIAIAFIPFIFSSCTEEELKALSQALKEVSSEVQTKERKKPEIAIPKDYYRVNIYPNRANTYLNLYKFMKEYRGLRKYKKHIYDCSEMSALLERDLEDAGFDAYIAVGPSPWSNSKVTNHAWVFVKTKKTISESYGIVQTKQYTRTEWVPIELTAGDVYNLEEKPTIEERLGHWWFPGIIPPVDSKYRKYFNYTKLYSSIYDIPTSDLDEYDWWKVLK